MARRKNHQSKFGTNIWLFRALNQFAVIGVPCFRSLRNAHRHKSVAFIEQHFSLMVIQRDEIVFSKWQVCQLWLASSLSPFVVILNLPSSLRVR